MKIKYYGFNTFKIACEKVSILTDPVSLIEAGFSLPSVESEIVLFSDEKFVGTLDILKQEKLDKKISSTKRDSIYEVANFGEYAIGDVFIRRPIKGGFYIIDEGYLRVVYMGLVGPDFDTETVKDLGDVDMLILPVGDGEIFPGFQKLEKILNHIDPTYLLPSCYKVDKLASKYASLKSVDDFLKDYGVSAVERAKDLKISNAPEKEEKTMQVVILED